MKAYWGDLEDHTRGGAWRALSLTVSGRDRALLAVQASAERALQIVVRDAPIFFARVEPEHYGYHTLRAQTDPLHLLPPIEFSLIASLGRQRAATSRDWARVYAERLESSEASPLHTGAWTLGASSVPDHGRSLDVQTAKRTLAQPAFDYADWHQLLDPLALRDASEPDSGRVKAYRKHARAGTLPPVLLYWVSGLMRHVVLDGHDRLLAAVLEGVPAPVLYLEAVEHVETSNAQKAAITRVLEERTLPTPHANDLALRTFVPGVLAAVTRSRPLDGGEAAWASAVRAALDARGIEDEDAFIALEVAHVAPAPL